MPLKKWPGRIAEILQPALRFGLERPEKSRMEIQIASEDVVVRHVNRPAPFHTLLRANRLLVLAVLWAALAACIVGALAFDIANWLGAWRDFGFDLLSFAAAAV